MSLIGTMYVGRTGLVNLGKGINITSDNLSNLNTYGFKESRGIFSDVFSKKININSIGLGTQLTSVDTIFLEGSINVTDIPTDLAIHGKGFFMVYDPNSQKTYYTRNGAFHLENYNENYVKIVNPSGFSLKGQQLNNIATNIAGTGEILIPKNLAGKNTSLINLRFNLDASIEIEKEDQPLKDAWNPEEDPPIKTSDYDWLLKVPYVDAQGRKKELTFYFDRTTEENQYEFIIISDPKAEEPLSAGTITFDGNGFVKEIQGPEMVSGADAKKENPDLEVEDTAALLKLELGENLPLFLDLGLKYNGNGELISDQNAITSFASPFVSYYQYQNGYAPGFLESISVDSEGIIHATYSNNQTLEVAQILLASFTSDTVLSRVGQTLFEAPPGIQPAIFEPGNDMPASIVSGALEASNVDIAQEMVNLITLQRAFQSNSKAVTVADQLLDDVIRMR